MRIDKIYIEEFKNLNQFCVDLDETKMHTVFIGENAAGKSNLLEAIVIIFRDLDLDDQTVFDYIIEYQCKGNLIKVEGGPNIKGKFQMYLGERKDGKIEYSSRTVSKKEIREHKEEYLPKYVFSYYSGLSNRLLEHFDKHQKRFYDDLLKGVNAPQRPLFYARLIHSHFVLMAFYAFQDEEVNNFLAEYLDIIGLESILFVLKKPNWSGDKKTGDPKFWYAKGVVKDFLNDLWEASMAPIKSTATIREDFNKYPEQEQLYLYVSNQDKLQSLAGKYGTNTEFFKSLESTYISDLIQEVRIKVKKRNVNGDITFKELSEGEQQLLTVLGLLRFTKEEESLILLDEPDTHLNPLWKWKYLNLIEKIAQEPESSQILMTTHDPLVIGGLTKEEIRIFHAQIQKVENGKEIKRISTFQPDFDPRGLGVAGILTSEFFNLPSTLDEATLKLLNDRNELITKQSNKGLDDDELEQLNDIFLKLSGLGINTTDRDPLYQKFLTLVSQRDEFKIEKPTKEDKRKQDEIALEILDELFKEEDL
ncbi:ATP-binding protein [Paludibacter sp.]|uniref:AAA family ATPase n=1 Tax=Paludibacter sp. TaxID=1898105 RepID=UPI00135589BF|nr:ATP-binding protein [Paludibacter sp.]MTK53757.1 AAA family ATPase [Paludibacter sp.]